MRNDVLPAVMAAWAAKDLPARLDVVETAKLLGFAEHDLQVLMAAGKLLPLGDPAANAPKWFAALEVLRLATDREWLHKATREVGKHWRQKRERRRAESRFGLGRVRTGQGGGREVPPKSSPESSPNERWANGEGAMGER